MARLHRLWAFAAVSVASLGVGFSLLLGGALGTAAATGASPSATSTTVGASAAAIFGCRASVARVSLASNTLGEPAVANPATAPCTDDTSLVQSTGLLGVSSPLDLGTVGPAGAYTYETGALGSATSPGATSVVDVNALSLKLGQYTLSVAGPIESQAFVACEGTATQFNGTSNLDAITLTGPGLPAAGETLELGGVVNQVVGNLPAALSALVSITANEQTTTTDSLTERMLDIKLLTNGAQVVVGEATASAPNPDICTQNVPGGTNTVTVPGSTQTITSGNGTATTVTSPGTVQTVTGTNGTVTVSTGGSTTVVEPSGSVPGYLQVCATGSTLDPTTGDCVIVYQGQTIVVSKPFKGPVGGTVYPLGEAKDLFHSTCLSGAGPDYVLVISKSGIQAKGTPVSDRIIITGSRDHVAGLAGDDCIDGQGTNERITDGNGKDRLYYHRGYNVVVAGNGSNLVRGEGRTSAYIIDGTGNDYIYAGNLRTIIQAYGDGKHIYGGAGNDRIWTNSQVAKISCGGGKANVVFARQGPAAYAKKHGCQKIGLLH